MNITAPPPDAPTDPAALLRGLSTDAIRRRLAELDAESRALRVLLRSVGARERALARQKEAGDA
jgi:hypothetical protein